MELTKSLVSPYGVSHLRKVLTRLREHKQYVKMEKCEWLCPTVILYFVAFY